MIGTESGAIRELVQHQRWASMGPCLDRHGKLLHAKAELVGPMLQWGRALIGTESSSCPTAYLARPSFNGAVP